MAASTAVRELGNRRVRKEQRQLASAETDRQRRFGEQSRAKLAETTPQFDTQAQLAARGQETARWEQALNPLVTTDAIGETPVGSSDPVEVKTEAARQLAKSLTRGKDQVRAAAQMGAYGDTQQANQFTLGRAGQELGRIADFSRGSQDVLDFEMLGAQEKADPYNLASDVIGSLGDLYGLYAITGPPKPKTVRTRASFGH